MAVVFVVLLLISSQAAGIQTGTAKKNYQLDVVVHLNKTDYRIGEPVWLTIRVVNKSEPGPYLDEVVLMASGLSLFDENDQRLQAKFFVSHTVRQPMRVNDTLEVSVDVVCRYGESYQYNGSAAAVDSLPPGQYKLVCSLPDNKERVLLFAVSEPRGVEKQMYAGFLKIVKLFSLYYQSPQLDKKSEMIKTTEKEVMRYLTQYPNSVYSASLLYQFLAQLEYTKSSMHTIIPDLAEEFYVRFPNDPALISVLGTHSSYYYKKNDFESIRALYSRMKDMKYGRKITKIAKEVLENLEKKEKKKAAVTP